jgi:hypothetical protein
MAKYQRRLKNDGKWDLAGAFLGIDTHPDSFVSTFLPPKTASRTRLLLVNRAGRWGIIEFSSIHELDSFGVDPPRSAPGGTFGQRCKASEAIKWWVSLRVIQGSSQSARTLPSGQQAERSVVGLRLIRQ